jgi:hypothetical protein
MRQISNYITIVCCEFTMIIYKIIIEKVVFINMISIIIHNLNIIIIFLRKVLSKYEMK